MAAYAYGAVNPGAPSMTFVAVGKNGGVVRSVDGKNWQQIYNIPTSVNLNGVAEANGAFIAVGELGNVITSSDGGLTWTLSTTAAAVTSNTLNAIRCANGSSVCVAVGAGGTTLWSYDGGRSWSLQLFGTNNWTSVAYGNNNANADAIVSDQGGVLTIGSRAINTWVIGDASGNIAYTNSASGVSWNSVSQTFTSTIVAIDYASRFVAMDGNGNTYSSEDGISWEAGGASYVTSPVAMISNGMGFVAVGALGVSASSF